MNTSHLACPYCGRVNEAHDSTTTPDATPADGDVSICWGCTNIAMFVVSPAGTALRKPTSAEEADLAADEHVQRARGEVARQLTPADTVTVLRGDQ